MALRKHRGREVTKGLYFALLLDRSNEICDFEMKNLLVYHNVRDNLSWNSWGLVLNVWEMGVKKMKCIWVGI